MHDCDFTIGIGRLEPEMQQRDIADPSLVFHLDRVVTQRHDEIGPPQELPLHLAASALDTAERQ